MPADRPSPELAADLELVAEAIVAAMSELDNDEVEAATAWLQEALELLAAMGATVELLPVEPEGGQEG
jgi:hypothetical protein